jgi:hypothetical protein
MTDAVATQYRSRSLAGVVAPALAGALAVVSLLTGASGGDIAAAVYRVDLFRRFGLALWDSGWYAGHWTLDYSVLFPPIGAALGISLTDVLCAAIGAWAFDRLVERHYGRLGHCAAALFALGTLVQVAVGRVPFLIGETLALVALLAGVRRLWLLALPLAFAASLSSPLAGAFLALAAVAWLLADLPVRNVGAGALALVATLPVVALEVLFPGQGTMPFSTLDFLAVLAPSVALVAMIDRSQRGLRIGVALYALGVLGSYVVPSAVGVNITRLATSIGLSVMVLAIPSLGFAHHRSSRAPRRILAVRAVFAAAAISLVLIEWAPAAGALLGARNPGVSRSYFAPLLGYLVPRDRPLGRVEVVPTAGHWESVYVALRLPLARGWERQLDTADNPIFYNPGRLNDRSYLAWLEHNGVRFVALSNAPLDYIAGPEAHLVRSGVPGLPLVWSNANWRVYKVARGPGIVSGAGGELLSEQSSTVVLAARRPGALLLRVHYSPNWTVTSGRAALRESPGGWLSVAVRHAGRIVLAIGA